MRLVSSTSCRPGCAASCSASSPSSPARTPANCGARLARLASDDTEHPGAGTARPARQAGVRQHADRPPRGRARRARTARAARSAPRRAQHRRKRALNPRRRRREAAPDSSSTDRLSLGKVLDARTERDFNGLDSFLLGRLSAFFDKTIQFSDLEEVRQSIHLVLAKRADVYDKVRKALHSRYALDLTATWQRADGAHRRPRRHLRYLEGRGAGAARQCRPRRRGRSADDLPEPGGRNPQRRAHSRADAQDRRRRLAAVLLVAHRELQHQPRACQRRRRRRARADVRRDRRGRGRGAQQVPQQPVGLDCRGGAGGEIGDARSPGALDRRLDLVVHAAPRPRRHAPRRAGGGHPPLHRSIHGGSVHRRDEPRDVVRRARSHRRGHSRERSRRIRRRAGDHGSHDAGGDAGRVDAAGCRRHAGVEARVEGHPGGIEEGPAVLLPHRRLAAAHAVAERRAARVGLDPPEQRRHHRERSARVRRRQAGLLGPRRCRSPPADGAELNHAAEPAGAPGAAAAAARRGRDAPRRASSTRTARCRACSRRPPAPATSSCAAC